MVLIAADGTWDYQSTANTVPADPSAVTVPGAGWTLGQAPFGTAGSFIPDVPINTAWTVNTGLWLKRSLTTDGFADVILVGRFDNAMFVYINGEYVAATNPTNELREPFRRSVVIPKSFLPEGTHQIALLCLDEAGGADGTTYVYVEADYAPAMLTLQPSSPARETLQWLTDIQASKDNTEDRLQLRLNPRQTFEFTYPANHDQIQQAFNVVFGRKTDDWLVPVWPQGQLVGAIAAGSTGLTLNTSAYDVRLGLALLWESPDRFQLITVDAVGVGGVLFTNPTDEFDNAWFMPVSRAFIPGNTSKRLNGHNASHSITFQVTGVTDLVVPEPDTFTSPGSMGELDIYFDEGLLADGELSDEITGQLDVHDEALGTVTYYAPWLNNRVAHTHIMISEDREEAWTIREWIYRRAGKYRAFWQPSFENDLRHRSTGTVTTQLIVAADEYRQSGSARTHIAIQTRAGWFPAAITASVATSSTEIQLTLDRSLGIAASDILRVCWLGAKRLNADSVIINWIGGGVCKVEVRLLELAP